MATNANLIKYGEGSFKSAIDFANNAMLYTSDANGNSDSRYATDSSRANAYSNTGGDLNNAIGYIEFLFKDKNYGICPLYRIEKGKNGVYNYNNCKLGWACDFQKKMIPLYKNISDAGSSALSEFGTNASVGNELCSVGFGDPVFNNGGDDKFWEKTCFVTHAKPYIEQVFTNGHNKKQNSKKDLCPCVIISDPSGSRSGDAFGYNTSKNSHNPQNRHALGNFALRDKLYIYACANIGGTVYIYCAIPFKQWWQDEGVWEIFQGIKSNYEISTNAYGGWVKLDTILADTSSFTVTSYEPNENHPASKGFGSQLAASDRNIMSDGYIKEIFGGSYNPESLSPYTNIHSVIGLPFSFLSNTDLRYGKLSGSIPSGKTGYGKEYMENIIYDMPIAVIKPGVPVRDTPEMFQGFIEKAKGYASYFVSGGSAASVFQSCISNWITNDYERFYIFNSQYAEYVQYVNTLCHMFAIFMGIADKDCPTALGQSGGKKTYGQYDDTMSVIDAKNGQFTAQFGTSPAVFCYYQPNSQLNATFNTSTTESSAQSTISDLTEKRRQYGFFGEMLGIGGSGSFLGDVLEDVSGTITGWFDEIFGSSIGEGANDILQGNNISLPEIWSDSTTEVQHNIKVKLVSPYGDPECVFLYVLRPLARLLALTLPHQTSANSYTAPFIVQAFSKGQFNCQLGVVTSFSLTRGGEGGESHTVHHVPTEIEVDMTITDMYEKVMMSNEYAKGKLFASFNPANWKREIGLLLNNIGLMDFVASYAGYNLNAPSSDEQMSFIANIIKNRVSDAFIVSDAAGKIVWPSWDRSLVDAFNNTVQKSQSLTSG